jgi:hypothetical protein
MPRVVQPGGGGGKMRVRYTARRKRGLVATAKRMMAEEGKTLRAASEELCVIVANLLRWVLQGMGEIDCLDKILMSKKKAALTGPSSQLKAIEGDLLRYIFEQREQGVEIKYFTVMLRVSYMSSEFREKSLTARCSCVKRFMPTARAGAALSAAREFAIAAPNPPYFSSLLQMSPSDMVCSCVRGCVRSCAGYFLFHVNRVHCKA